MRIGKIVAYDERIGEGRIKYNDDNTDKFDISNWGSSELPKIGDSIFEGLKDENTKCIYKFDDETNKQKTLEYEKREKENKIMAEKKAEKNFGLFFIFVLLAFAIYMYNAINSKDEVSTSTSSYSSYCYEIGYKYGSCFLRSLYGLKCKEDTDISVPTKCKNTKEFLLGMKAGTASER